MAPFHPSVAWRSERRISHFHAPKLRKRGTASAARFGEARCPATECASSAAQILLRSGLVRLESLLNADDDNELPPEHWADCAQQARALAELVKAPECRKILLEIAAGYECMADAARRFRQYGGTVIEGIIHAASGVKSSQP